MKRLLIVVAALVVLAGAVGLVARPDTPKKQPPAPGVPTNTETTITGGVVCLPHKDTSGPQTLECAYGIKLADNTYYALRDSDSTYANISLLPTGKQARVTGTLKEEQSDIYQSKGTFTVTKAEPL